MGKEDKKKVSAEDMFSRLLQREGLSLSHESGDDGPTMTELDVAMSALKVAHAIMNLLLNKGFVSVEEAMEYLALSHQAIDSYIDIVDHEPDGGL